LAHRDRVYHYGAFHHLKFVELSVSYSRSSSWPVCSPAEQLPAARRLMASPCPTGSSGPSGRRPRSFTLPMSRGAGPLPDGQCLLFCCHRSWYRCSRLRAAKRIAELRLDVRLDTHVRAGRERAVFVETPRSPKSLYGSSAPPVLPVLSNPSMRAVYGSGSSMPGGRASR
jgi:hypothetical protein